MPLIVTISEISFGIALADNEIEVSMLGDAKEPAYNCSGPGRYGIPGISGCIRKT
jgi:hypothetical protein